MLAGPPPTPWTAASESPPAERGVTEGGEGWPHAEALLVEPRGLVELVELCGQLQLGLAELCGQLALGQRRAREALAEDRAGGPQPPGADGEPGRTRQGPAPEAPPAAPPVAGGRRRRRRSPRLPPAMCGDGQEPRAPLQFAPALGDDRASVPPKATPPRATSPRATSPRATSPRAPLALGDDRASMPPTATSPRATSPRATSPRETSPRATSPRSSLAESLALGDDRASMPPRATPPRASPPEPIPTFSPTKRSVSFSPTRRPGGRGSRKSLNSSSMQSMTSAARSPWWCSAVSIEPMQTPAGATGAIDLIEHDPIGEYDLQCFWLDSAPTATRSYNKKSAVWMTMMPWSFRRFVSDFDWGTSALQQRANKLVSSTGYELCVMLMIIANSAFLGWQVEHEAQTRRRLPMTTEAEAFFCMLFTMELAIKMYAMGGTFWIGDDAAWNYFDIVVVVLMVFDFFGGMTHEVSGLRILRVLRVVRFLRSVRQLRFFSQLRIMIRSIMYSLRPLLWATLVLTGMFYVFGLCFTQGVTDHLRAHGLWEDSSTADMRRYFGTVPRCALSLFEAMSGGVNWGELFDTLSPLNLRFRILFLFYVLFAIFGTANVVTGIFVEIANHWAHSDSSSQEQSAAEKRVEVIKRLRDLFQDLDTGGDGKLTLEGMRHAISDVSRGLVNSFHALDLEVTDVRTLFLLLDRERKGYINLNDFLLGCFRLTGEAKTLDVMKLQYQCEWMMHNMLTVVGSLDRANEGRTSVDTVETPETHQQPGRRQAPASETDPERTAGAGVGHESAIGSRQMSALMASWSDQHAGQRVQRTGRSLAVASSKGERCRRRSLESA